MDVLIAGATGYMGSRLAERLIIRRHSVAGLTRLGSRHKLPRGCRAVVGDALNGDGFAGSIGSVDCYVQLVGVAHPSPSKSQEFREIDLKSCQESLRVAVKSRVRHFIYVSVAHPAPAMRAYIDVRIRCEEMIRQSGLNATILRPWYVLGPGHYWPYALKPVYWLARQVQATRDGAVRLGLVSLGQMLDSLTHAVERPADGIRIVGVPEISERHFANRAKA